MGLSTRDDRRELRERAPHAGVLLLTAPLAGGPIASARTSRADNPSFRQAIRRTKGPSSLYDARRERGRPALLRGRRVHAQFTHNADGSFPTITPTATGPKPIANLNPFIQTEAETMAWESGVQTEATSDMGGGMDVTGIENGD
jgi:hypothetical protein